MEVRETKEHKINERIHADQVRLIGEAGEQIGIVPIDEARRIATEATLDLVEVAPDSKPPVCRVMDYGKVRYEHKKKLHESHKKAHVSKLKEVRLRPKTDVHDIGIKRERAKTEPPAATDGGQG